MAGLGIEAGGAIEAGDGIKAGEGIVAGLSIHSKWIDCRLRIFAGLVNHRSPQLGDDEIRAEIRGGEIAFGNHVAPAIEAGS